MSKIYLKLNKNIGDCFFYLKSKINDLNEKNLDVIINFNFSKLSSIIASSIYSKMKLGAKLLDSKTIFIGNRFLRDLFFELDECKKKEHILNYFFKALNIEFKNFFLKKNNSSKFFNIIIHPGASEEKKKWGINNYFNLIKLINSKIKSLRIIISGGTSEIDENKLLEKKLLNENIQVLNLTGKMTLRELLIEINKSDLLISSDTAIAHLGALTLTKSITIFLGGAYHYHTFPYQNNKIVVYPEISCYPCEIKKECKNNFKCRKCITPRDVYSIIEGDDLKNSHKTIEKDGYIILQ